MAKKKIAPAMTIADVEAAVWRFSAAGRKGKAESAREIARVLFICEAWAISCGADADLVKMGRIEGLPGVGDGRTKRSRSDRLHLWRGREVVCGQDVGRESLTEDESAVTCGNCKRKMERRAIAVETSQPVRELAVDGAGRKCRSCELPLPLDAFARDRQDWAGRKRICRECDNARRRGQARSKAAERPVVAA